VFTDKKYSLSVMIIVKDEPSIEQTLDRLRQQCEANNAECLVIDASEGRLDYIKDKHVWTRWVEYKQPIDRKFTIPHQRNYAVQTALTDILLFCDAGGLPEENWIENLAKPLLTDREVLVGGPIIYTNHGNTTSRLNFQTDGTTLRVSTTANIGFTRAAYDLVGGFNESLNYGSDTDFIWKLEAQGITHSSVSSAIMRLEGGSFKREQKRQWRYGRAMIDLLVLHKRKRKVKVCSNPEILIYPFLTLFWIVGCFYLTNRPFFIMVPLSLTIALLVKNSRTPHSIRIVYLHYIYGLGMISRTIQKAYDGFKIPRVIVFPADKNRYTSELISAIGKQNLKIGYFPKLTHSASLNTVLLPFYSPVLRLRGSCVVHIHWLYTFSFVGKRNILVLKLLEFWFIFWLWTLRVSGIKVIYTNHNALPHENVFLNDQEMVSRLIKCSSLVINLNSRSSEILLQRYTRIRQVLIEEGPLNSPTTHKREDFREKLKAGDRTLVVLIGNLRPYKGVDLLIESLTGQESCCVFRIAGNSTSEYRGYLDGLVKSARDRGVDIEISHGFLTQNDYGGYLVAADYFCVPFKEINNSGSINSALCAGVPLIVPDIPDLDWVPRRSRFPFILGFNFNDLAKPGSANYAVMVGEALTWKSTRNWDEVARLHIEQYESVGPKILRKNKRTGGIDNGR